MAEQATVAWQAEILRKLEELEALEQGKLSDQLDSETLGRLAEAVQTDYAGLTAAGTGDKIDSQVTAYIETLRKQPIPEGVTYGAED